MRLVHQRRFGVVRSGLVSLATFLAAGLAATPVAGQSLPKVSPEVARQHLLKKVAPVYPPIAEAARIQGPVELEAAIGPDGRVTGTDYISGPPLLVQAAMDAVKKWRYRPFLVHGKPTAVGSRVELIFSLGFQKARMKQVLRASRAYSQGYEECDSLLTDGRYAEAEEPCSRLPQLAGDLPPESSLERTTAYGKAAEPFFKQAEYSKAVPLLEHQVAAGKPLGPYDVDQARAYWNLAVAYDALGDSKRAGHCYKQAISIIRNAMRMARSKAYKRETRKTLVTVLRQYALYLQKEGDLRGSAKMQKRANAEEKRLRNHH